MISWMQRRIERSRARCERAEAPKQNVDSKEREVKASDQQGLSPLTTSQTPEVE